MWQKDKMIDVDNGIITTSFRKTVVSVVSTSAVLMRM